MILVYLTLAMVLIHIAGTVLSFSGRTFPKAVGYPIAVYEMAYYFFLVLSQVLYVNYILTAIAYLYLLVHVIGGVAYLRGLLGAMYTPTRLKYYGAYELVEALYLVSVLLLV